MDKTIYGMFSRRMLCTQAIQGCPETFPGGGGEQLWDDRKEKYTPLAFFNPF